MKPAVYSWVNLETCVLNTSKLANKLTSFVNKYTKKQTNFYISVTKGTVVLAEVDSGDDPTDSDLDSESTDNESELTDLAMPSTASTTSSGRTVIRGQGHKKNTF